MPPSRKRTRENDGGARSASAGGYRGPYPGFVAELRHNPASGYMRQYHPRSAQTLETYGPSRSRASAEQLARRDAERVYGRGRYSLGKNFRKLSQSIGLAGQAKRALRGAVSAGLGMIGQGAYTTNSLIDTDMTAVPHVSSTADETGAVTVSRREYLRDILASGQSFTVQAFSLNPGLEDSFPWLSQVAANYEEYDLHQCVYTYRSTVTDVGTTTSGQTGTIIMATNYNAAAAPFDDKAAMMEYDGAMSCKASSDMLHGVECDDAKRSGSDAHYVRSGPCPPGQDVKTYDHGTFQLAQANVPFTAGTQLGELWVSYTVVLRKPKFAVGRGVLIQQDYFVSRGEADNAPMGAVNSSGVLNQLLQGAGNSIGTTFTKDATGGTGTPDPGAYVITFPPDFSGAVEVGYCLEGFTTGGAAFATPILFGNVSFRRDMYASGVDVTDSPSYVQVQTATTSGGTTQGRWHFNIAVASGGVANQVKIPMIHGRVLVTTGVNAQSQIHIFELSPAVSYKGMAVGPIALRSDAPVMIDTNGTVVAL